MTRHVMQGRPFDRETVSRRALAVRSTRTLSNAQLFAEARVLLAQVTARGFDWARHARPEQLEPQDYMTWLIMAGRGWGKTKCGAETSRARASARPGQEIAVIGRTHRETRDVCFEHRKSGLVTVIPEGEVAGYTKSPLRLTLRNGSVFTGFSAEEPDSMRGYAFDYVWGDEFGAWPRQSAQAVFDMAWFCLREATDPAMLLTTTPRPFAHVTALVDRAGTDPSVVLTTGATQENAAHLSLAALAELEARYAGSRLGRQELGGELLRDVENALLGVEDIDAGRRLVGEVPTMAVVVTGVDPATTKKTTSDETGIITVGVDAGGHGWVLDDASDRFSPDGWGRAVWAQVTRHGSQAVVVEDNQGGDMVEHVLRSTWNELQRERAARAQPGQNHPPIVRVHPSGEGQGKWARAQPIAALYQQGRIHHVHDPAYTRESLRPDGGHDVTARLSALEDQATTWTGRVNETSPDRVDALVHALTWALFPSQRAKGAPAAINAPASHRWTRGARR